MLNLHIPLWKLCGWFRRLQLWATDDWQLPHDNVPAHHVSCRVFWQNIKSPKWLSPLHPRFGALQHLAFPKTKSHLKGKRFQTVDEIQENTMGQLMVMGRAVWGPKVPTLKGTEVSLSYIWCFLYLVYSITVSFSYYMAGYFLDRPHLYLKWGRIIEILSWITGWGKSRFVVVSTQNTVYSLLLFINYYFPCQQL